MSGVLILTIVGCAAFVLAIHLAISFEKKKGNEKKDEKEE